MRLHRIKVRRPSIYPPVWINHGPGIVRLDEANWRTFNGIGWKWGTYTYWLSIRSEDGVL
ncbi:hypothetical protein SEA_REDWATTLEHOG_94 [Gordonia phage RedWattleHog]|uniref:Uncharacterized protein n=1 Tax=Gordonia phage Stormageddon TaxID=2656541 RepID=A0A649VTR8_9CAUD|nr:hypothetical protein KHQ86_gp209 [Gordonia phage Stormageddon]QGJ94953.1 hypothetical protein SEA_STORMAGEDDON_91 [Gordonia phage Stormageddon]QLF83597.1 hypothetical protein SEA_REDWATTLEHOG_94 [Gordonia phage RedWattleHog]